MVKRRRRFSVSSLCLRISRADGKGSEQRNANAPWNSSLVMADKVVEAAALAHGVALTSTIDRQRGRLTGSVPVKLSPQRRGVRGDASINQTPTIRPLRLCASAVDFFTCSQAIQWNSRRRRGDAREADTPQTQDLQRGLSLASGDARHAERHPVDKVNSRRDSFPGDLRERLARSAQGESTDAPAQAGAAPAWRHPTCE